MAVVRFLATRSFVVQRDRLLLVIHRPKLWRWGRNAVDMMMWDEFWGWAEKKQQHWEVEETVDCAEKPERNQQEEEMFNDEFE